MLCAMPQTSKKEQAARAAIDDAAKAAKQARKAAKDFPSKAAKKVRELAAEAEARADVSKKSLRKKPVKVATQAKDAAARVRKATAVALAKVERKAALRAEAERAAADAARAEAEAQAQAAAAKALKKAAGKADKAARRAAADADKAVAAIEPQDAPGTEPVPDEPAGTPIDVRDVPEPEAPAAPNLALLSVALLRVRARQAGHTGYSRLTKAQLIALLSS